MRHTMKAHLQHALITASLALGLLAIVSSSLSSSLAKGQQEIIGAADGTELYNLAFGRPAGQSSVAGGGYPSLAVDGNTDGDFSRGSVALTYSENQPWWQVDLQYVQRITSIQIWSRTDCCAEQLSDFYVFVSDQPFPLDLQSTLLGGYWNQHVTSQTERPITIPAGGRWGRYVRIWKAGFGPLSLAEVQVFGIPPLRSLSGGAYTAAGTALDGFGVITVEAWVKPPLNASGEGNVVSLRTADWRDLEKYALRLNTLRQPEFVLLDNLGRQQWVTGGAAVTAGAWHHLAGVFEGSQMRLYVDGVLSGSKSTGRRWDNAQSYMKMGEAGSGMLIDEVRVTRSAVYSANFLPQTRKRLFNLPATIGLWKFDYDSPNDSSPSGCHATLYADSSFSANVP
jgi:hypothetical protein